MAFCDSTRPSAMGQVNLFGNPLEKEKQNLTTANMKKPSEAFVFSSLPQSVQATITKTP